MIKLTVVLALGCLSPIPVLASSACAARLVLGSATTDAGDGGPAKLAQLAGPAGLAYDSAGNLYVADSGNNKIRKIDASGVITTFAGNGAPGAGGDGGPATAASLNDPTWVAIDKQGNVFITDVRNNKIRRVAPNGVISTVAGTGRPGYSGDGGAATSALLNYPLQLAIDLAGEVFFIDQLSALVRKIGTDGVITTVAGSILGHEAEDNTPATQIDLIIAGLAVTAGGDVLISNVYLSTGLLSIDADGNVKMLTSEGDSAPVEGARAIDSYLSPLNIIVLADGSLLVTVFDQGGRYQGEIWKIRVDGTLHKFADALPYNTIAAGPANTILQSDYGHSIYTYSETSDRSIFAGGSIGGTAGDGGPAISATIYEAENMTTDPSGSLYFIDGFRIRRISTDGLISTFAGDGTYGSSGDGGPASKAQIIPNLLVSDFTGNLFFVDYNSRYVRKIDTTGTISRLAGAFSCQSSQCGSATSGSFSSIGGLAAGNNGNVYVLDGYYGLIWVVDSQSNIAVYFRRQELQNFFQNFYGQMFFNPKTNDLNLFDRSPSSVWDIKADGSYTELPSAPYIVQPSSFAIDKTGLTYLADSRKIIRQNSDASLTTVFHGPPGSNFISIGTMAADVSGALYFGDRGENRIFKIDNASTCDNHEPLVTYNGALNAASYGGIAPGSIVTLFAQHAGPDQPVNGSISDGRFGTQAGNTRVLFDGIAAPVIYASSGQVSAIAPYAIAGEAYTSITVEVNGIASNRVTTNVADAAPGIFTQNASGKGAGSILNQDYSLNTPAAPAAKGSIISVYASGEGVTAPAGVDGLIAGDAPPKPVLAVTATIDGQSADVLYAGGAPSEVAGVLQVNIRVPAAANSGPAIPIQIMVGANASQSGVTIAVH